MSTEPMALFPPSGPPLFLDGALTLSESYDGAVTRQPLIDRADATRGGIDRGRRLVIRALLPQSPALRFVTVSGAPRWEQVEALLEQWRLGKVILRLARHQRSEVDDILLETWNSEQAGTDGLDITLSLVRLRIVSTSTVALAALPPPRPRPDKAASATTEKAAGSRNISLLKSGTSTVGSALSSLLGGG